MQTSLQAGLAQSRAPGGQAAVVHCGRVVWSDAAGVTDAASKTPVTQRTRFVLASTTKTVTAIMVMQLVERGALTLTSPVADFFPSLPNASRITVEMLLRHTSGLPDYEDDDGLSRAMADPRHGWTRTEVIGALREADEDPGVAYRYANSNYVVLGGIIEAAARDGISGVFSSGIATPLGLKDSTFAAAVEPGHVYAHPHQADDDGTINDVWVPGVGIASHAIGPVWTDGGMTSTARELAVIGDALFGGRLLKPETLAAMTRIDEDGGGLGLAESENESGRVWFGHSGSYGGFESALWHDRARGLTIAVTANLDSEEGVADAIWDAVAAVVDDVAQAPCAASIAAE